MAVTITLTFRWPMGHRILGLDGPGAKCRNIHGHNWVADVELPNDEGFLEFGDVKASVGRWLEQRWDHGFMCEDDDPFLDYLIAEGLKHYAVDCQPTTECVATELAAQVEILTTVLPVRVHVQEGYRNAATWTPS